MTAELVGPLSATVAEGVRRRIDRLLADFIDDHRLPVTEPGVEEGFGLLREFVVDGGKRIRPLLCYWGWRGAGGDAEGLPAVTAGAAVELYHAGLLIHDDIMDASDLRRGRPTLHRRLGASTAILLGVLVQAWADELMAQATGDPHVRALFNRLRAEVISGQYLDILAEPGEERARLIVRYKTAKYTVERPLQIGGALAGAAPDLLAAYSRFGLPLGEAFQLRDDVLGVFGDTAVTGKPVLDDLREGKQTVLIAHTLEAATPPQRAHLRRWLGDQDLTEERAAELRQIIVDTGALTRVEAAIAALLEQSLAGLAACPIAPDAREALAHFADRLTCRAS